jgi:hypothetical protein
LSQGEKMLDLHFLLMALWDIVVSGLQIVWPLMIVAFGLAELVYFGDKDRVKTVVGWIIIFGGLFLFFINVTVVKWS